MLPVQLKELLNKIGQYRTSIVLWTPWRTRRVTVTVTCHSHSHSFGGSHEWYRSESTAREPPRALVLMKLHHRCCDDTSVDTVLSHDWGQWGHWGVFSDGEVMMKVRPSSTFPSGCMMSGVQFLHGCMCLNSLISVPGTGVRVGGRREAET